MDKNFTAVINNDENWWIDWIEEIPRHREINDMLVKKICKDLGLKL